MGMDGLGVVARSGLLGGNGMYRESDGPGNIENEIMM
jgi:hypothetical protein